MDIATSPSNALELLIAVLILASVHLLVKNLQRIDVTPRHALLSAGASLAYALMRILPACAPARASLESGAPDVEAIPHSAEHGATLTLLYPEFSVVVPTPRLSGPLGYSVARGNDELLRTLNAWLGEQKAKGTIDGLYRHWMLG